MSATILQRLAFPALCSLAAACTAGAPPPETMPPAGPAAEHYEARGQEPGWHLLIHGGTMTYTGNYGDVRIAVPRPDPRPSFNGLRYVTERLTVDVTYVRCNDAMSGHGYEHTVSVTANGQTFAGCGGPRRSDWDN